MQEKDSKFTVGQPGPGLCSPPLPSHCVLSVTPIRFLRIPGPMLNEVKDRRAGTEGGPWVVVGVREACRELECKEEEAGVGGNGEFSSLCAI